MDPLVIVEMVIMCQPPSRGALTVLRSLLDPTTPSASIHGCHTAIMQLSMTGRNDWCTTGLPGWCCAPCWGPSCHLHRGINVIFCPGVRPSCWDPHD